MTQYVNDLMKKFRPQIALSGRNFAARPAGAAS